MNAAFYIVKHFSHIGPSVFTVLQSTQTLVFKKRVSKNLYCDVWLLVSSSLIHSKDQLSHLPFLKYFDLFEELQNFNCMYVPVFNLKCLSVKEIKYFNKKFLGYACTHTHTHTHTRCMTIKENLRTAIDLYSHVS